MADGGELNFGDLKRFKPFCSKWGITRGGPIDRFYIDSFLCTELRLIKGRFLECGGQRYRHLISIQNIVAYDVVDLNPKVPSITICGDLQDLSSIPNDVYDAVICTQVLQYVVRPHRAIRELHRVLRPGGKLLLSVPFIEKDYQKMGDRWRFTREAVSALLVNFRERRVRVKGNLFSSVCYLLGLGRMDVSAKDLRPTDHSFYQIVLATGIK